MSRNRPVFDALLGASTCDDDEAASAFSDLFRRYGPYVATVSARILGRDDEVQDVVQDVFLVALKRLGDLRDPAALKFWLGRIAVNRASALLRWRRVRARLGLEKDFDYETLASREASPETKAEVARLYRVLDTLPVHQRIPWIMRYLAGEKLEDVATLCGCSLAAAKRRIAAAQSVIESALGGTRD